eukprot:TRINITY_DN29019_c1_g1_i1.p1 TRINITY_DN29019_c1_g1~~TRINITY_DN29019_c1_g1_i1.p1  ORF type:complete len:107 (+),score=14.33 TRINITY_DN29019_c1_g1_i1:136-456(+)
MRMAIIAMGIRRKKKGGGGNGGSTSGRKRSRTANAIRIKTDTRLKYLTINVNPASEKSDFFLSATMAARAGNYPHPSIGLCFVGCFLVEFMSGMEGSWFGNCNLCL